MKSKRVALYIRTAKPNSIQAEQQRKQLRVYAE